MFILTHAKAALDVLKDFRLTQEQKNQLIVGSILPDSSELKIADESRTHTEGLELIKSLGKDYHYLGVGAVLHGISPKGLDYYTHNGYYEFGRHLPLPIKITGTSGYLARKYGEIEPLLRHYKKSFGRMPFPDAAHFLIEFSFDHLTALQDNKFAKRVHYAMKANLDTNALIHFANYFNIDKKQLKRLKRVVGSKHVSHILNNFSTIDGTAHNLQNFIFLTSLQHNPLKHENRSAKYKFLGKMAQFARSSVGFFQTKIHDKSLVQLMERCVALIRKDYDPFMKNTVSEMRKMVKREGLVL